MSVWRSVTHKQMTVLYTTDHYLAEYTAEREMVCVFVHVFMICVCTRK